MREIGAFEAKNKLGTLLDRVENGEEVVITRHGKAVDRLIANAAAHDPNKGWLLPSVSAVEPVCSKAAPSTGRNTKPIAMKACVSPVLDRLGHTDLAL
jgi:antitoxin (DNA-binding transcriptional repressor) of toxin-antitoxin stability system